MHHPIQWVGFVILLEIYCPSSERAAARQASRASLNSSTLVPLITLSRNWLHSGKSLLERNLALICCHVKSNCGLKLWSRFPLSGTEINSPSSFIPKRSLINFYVSVRSPEVRRFRREETPRLLSFSSTLLCIWLVIISLASFRGFTKNIMSCGYDAQGWTQCTQCHFTTEQVENLEEETEWKIVYAVRAPGRMHQQTKFLVVVVIFTPALLSKIHTFELHRYDTQLSPDIPMLLPPPCMLTDRGAMSYWLCSAVCTSAVCTGFVTHNGIRSSFAIERFQPEGKHTRSSSVLFRQQIWSGTASIKRMQAT